MASLEQRSFNEDYNDDTPLIINANEPHMALVFLLDTSGSMRGVRIQNLNEGLNRFKMEVLEDKQTSNIVDVAIISFNTNFDPYQEFTPIMNMKEVNLTASGGTVMSPAIREALKMVDERSRFYRRTGTEPYKPWVILVTDGAPGDDITAVAQEIKDMEENELVRFISLGVEGYDSKVLHQLSGPKVMKLEGTDFTSFFDWVNKSMRSIHQSIPGEKPSPINLEGNVTIDRNTDFIY